MWCKQWYSEWSKRNIIIIHSWLIGYTEERRWDMRFLVKYRFVGDPQVVGVYRTAESVEDAFNAEKRMWKSWGKEIEFVEGFRVK